MLRISNAEAGFSTSLKKTGSSRFYKLFVEYFFCLFSLTTLPAINYSAEIVAGRGKLFGILYIIALILVFKRALLERKYVKLKIAVGILAILVCVSSAAAIDSTTSLAVFIINDARFFGLALLFLSYQSFDGGKVSIFDVEKIKNLSLLINAVILPLRYFLLGEFGEDGLLRTQAQAREGGYNSYLLVSDTFLFNSAACFVSRKDTVSLLLLIVSSVLGLLVGSRGSSLPGILIALLFSCLFYYSRVKSFLSSTETRFLKFNNFQIFAFLFSALFFTIVVFFFGNASVLIPEFLSLDNIFESRVWRSIFERDLSDDVSLSERESAFGCFYQASLNPLMLLLGSQRAAIAECSGIEYIHSTLSILIDYGIFGFLPMMYLISSSFARIFKDWRNTKIEFMMALTFLVIGFSARAGVSYLLPTLTFVYSQVTLNKTRRQNMSH